METNPMLSDDVSQVLKLILVAPHILQALNWIILNLKSLKFTPNVKACGLIRFFIIVIWKIKQKFNYFHIV